MKVRILSLFTICALLFCCVGCKNQGGTGVDEKNPEDINKNKYISIAYNSTDTFNPFTTKTDVNEKMLTLVFDSLIKLDENYVAVNCLAESVEVEGKKCTVTLKNAQFSDGSVVTASDVVYSFNAAKKTSVKYAAQLKSIVLANEVSVNTIEFICEKNDQYMQNLLTFPIIKSNTDDLKNEDNVEIPPIGCGRYIPNADRTELIANNNWHMGIPAVPVIRLISTYDDESLSHVIEIGAVDMYYTDLSDCNILRMSGTRINVTLNNLVFVGMNLGNPILKNVNFRQAISAAINRSKICEEAYYTNALPASGVFNPKWQAVERMQTIQAVSNVDIAVENLGKIGYNIKNGDGYFINSKGEPIAVRLLVNSENQFRVNAAKMIAMQLKASGIKVIIESVSYEQYVTRLNNKQFDLYLAEVKILDNMDVSSILCKGGSVAYGIVEQPVFEGENLENATQNTPSLQNVINGFYKGENTVSDIAAMAISEMPIVPICYRSGILFCSGKAGGYTIAQENDIFYEIDKLIIN